jgi:hypothetical protein
MDFTIAQNVTAIGAGDTAPATGTKGEFTSGNPATNTPATVLPGYQMNAIVEEIINAITSSGQTPSNTNNAQLAGALHGRLLNVQIFSTSGTHTYTPTSGTTSVIVEVQGGGGPGCGSPATGTGQTSQGGNGSSGSYARKRITSGFSGVTITVGAGGVGALGTVGTNGGASSFGTIVSAAGGFSGVNQGSTSTPSYFVPAATSPAAPSTGDINIQGAAGGNNFTTNLMGIISAAPYGMFAAGFGAAGFGFPNGASSPAIAGSNGQGGIVIVWEYS